MPDYCFYTPEAQILAESSGLKEKIERFSEEHKKQTYVMCRPLSKEDSYYDYDKALVIFSSGVMPCVVNVGSDDEAFEEYFDDFVEDVSYLSEKFKYREKIGRKKSWRGLFQLCNASDLDLSNFFVPPGPKSRVVDLVTSLVVGSINDVSKIDLDAFHILDVVKSKIVLFDTDQTSFVFKPKPNKKFVVQGLAGSGKTELLLHRLKEIYSNDPDAKIAFTCFNKILAHSMRSRIPEFFDFMRVERQIDWNNKLFCFHSWGGGANPFSGMYRYICHFYNIPFGSFQAGSFDRLCKMAIEDIDSQSEGFLFCFDYVFIDESQDFPESFIDLCEKVTSKKVYVAGDVFQNIFQPIDERVNRADMVLKKCYRTDPKNLMFSHALGMGLFENPVLRWLQKDEWDACGYHYREEEGRAVLSRDPLKRFEDLPDGFSSTSVTVLENREIADSLVEMVSRIIGQHPTVCPGDIAVLFLDRDSYIYDVITKLKYKINSSFGWSVNVSHETKTNDPDKFFISNVNNAKGLEFPFVICFAKNIRRVPSFRNALYTMMARSFLESHLVLGVSSDENTVEAIVSGLRCLEESGAMKLRIPSEDEIDKQKDFIVLDKPISIDDIVKRFCDKKGATPRLFGKLLSRAKLVAEDEDYTEEYLEDFLELEYQKHKKL